MSAEQALESGVQLHRQGRLADAEQLYRWVLERDSQNTNALNLLGLVGFQTNHIDDAITLFLGAIAANPTIADFYVNLAQCSRAQGHIDPAIEHLRRAIETNTTSVAAINNLAHPYVQENGTA